MSKEKFVFYASLINKHTPNAVSPIMIALQVGPTDVSEGETLQLSCAYGAYPLQQTFKWYRNDTQLNDSDSRVTIETDEDTTNLTLTGVLVSEGGQYTCYVTNNLGRGSASTSVSVQGTLHYTSKTIPVEIL